MNFSVANITIFTIGVVLIYAAIKDIDPRDVVKSALKGKSPAPVAPPPTPPTETGKPKANQTAWPAV